jgi:two-component system, OmpR family, response regulator
LPLITYLVEDNAVIRSNLIPALQDLADAQIAGHAEGEREAIAWLCDKHNAWHLAVVDLFLRDGSGLGVLQKCQVRQPNQKMVVLTNYATEDIRRRCFDLGADAVFDKSNELEAFFSYCVDNRAPTNFAPLR